MAFSITTRGPLTAADWTELNPVLDKFEFGIEIDPATGLFTQAKLGDGVTAWADLEYWNPAGSTGATKATGAELNTGTNDTKFATAKALADSDYINVAPQTHIADPTGAVTDQDDEARAAIASILDVLDTVGIVAAS